MSRPRPPAARRAVPAPYDRCVFVNCPFDDSFLPLLHALVFAIHDCGFIARLAVEDTGAGEMRIDKIVRIIRESRYSIHDISRVELSGASNLPRFNMPFEAGLAMGALRFERRHAADSARDFLLLDAVAFRDKQTLSDLAGQDAKNHDNDARKIVAAARAFLSAKNVSGRTRGGEAIWSRFERFQAELPLLATSLQISHDEITSFAYLRDWIAVVSAWITAPA